MMKDKKIVYILTLLTVIFMTGTVKAQNFDPTLTGLIKQGIAHSRQLKINDYKIKQTKIDRQIAYKTFLPKLSLNASYTRLNDDIRLDSKLEKLLKGSEKLLIKEALGVPFNTPLPPGIPTSKFPPIMDKNILKSSADLEWVLFSGLEATYAIKATKHKEKALKYAGKIAEKELVKDIIKAYDQLALTLASEKVIAFFFEHQLF